MTKQITFNQMFPNQAPAEIEAAKQAERNFNNFLESRRSEVDFLVEYGQPFYDGSEG
jgi:hypothetical protein